MSYEKRLLAAKAILTATAIAAAWPLVIGSFYDRGVVIWTISLPIFAYLLWGNVHGTGRSVRMMGLLGLAYATSFLMTGAGDGPLFPALLSAGFIIGTVLTLRHRPRTQTESATV